MGKSIILIRGFLYICTVVLEVPKPRMADAFSFSSVREVFSFVLGDNNVES
ncbi:unnamed protein product [Brassica napus]|uniref:(rape) hypothetical protein n=1 Tax=Brassica napus TaxID=3708 RepID=A0A816KE68_BRANA|nr:unnamed protein product [Brassica napus]